MDLGWVNPLQPAALLDLPVELLLHVTTYMDYQELFVLRMTCKTLETLTRTRNIWVKRIVDLQQTHHVVRPEEELDSYTTEELEQWVVKRTSAQSIISGATIAMPRVHKLELPFDFKRPTLSGRQLLLPGGRWLLVYHLASCYSLDLDSTQPEPVLLFNVAHIDQEFQVVLDNLRPTPFFTPPIWTQREIWVDDTKERLSFRIAIQHGYQNENNRTHIYQVKLVGHGKSASLAAKRLASFYRTQSADDRFVFNDRYTIEAIDRGDDVVLRIFHYTPTIGCFTEMPRINPLIVTIPECFTPFAEPQLIRGNTFLIVSLKHFRIFEIVYDSVTMVPQSVQLLHTIPHCLSWYSPPLSIDDGFRITGYYQGQYNSFWVPYNGDTPVIEPLGSVDPKLTDACTRDSRMFMTASSSLIFGESKKIEIVSHSKSMPFHSYTIPFGAKKPIGDRRLCYDGSVGRVVSSTLTYLIVTDLV